MKWNKWDKMNPIDINKQQDIIGIIEKNRKSWENNLWLSSVGEYVE